MSPLLAAALLLPGAPQVAPAPPAADHGQVCVSALLVRETVTVGTGRERIDLTLGGGACEPPGSGISTLLAQSPDGEESDAVIAEDCPAFRRQIAVLWSERTRRSRRAIAGRPVQAGPFLIAGRSDLFALNDVSGRRGAARWLLRTLDAVRPCWNAFRQDRSRTVAPRLYRLLRTTAR